ncbi:hypothetical protein BH20GEM1_BH20GEM1_10970 [soil metagenome]
MHEDPRLVRRSRWLGLAAMALIVGGFAAVGVSHRLGAADHRDSMSTENDQAVDIADVYSFVSPASTANVVLAMTVPGLVPPSEDRFFDPNALYQFKIDTNGDATEDLVIQVYATGTGTDQTLHFRGPAVPPVAGAVNELLPGDDDATVLFSEAGQVRVSTGGGLTVFAGVRDDPFFFDLARFRQIVAGEETSFRNPGVDTFAGTNALAIVVELPRTMLASQFGVWGTTNRS